MQFKRCQPSVCNLELLMKRIRTLRENLLDLDMYERHGQGTDQSMNLEMDKADEYRKESEALIKEITGKAQDLSAIDRESWANAHLTLIWEFIQSCKADERNLDFEISMAEEERDAWKKVRKGQAHYVRQNVSYVHYNSQNYQSLFGFEY